MELITVANAAMVLGGLAALNSADCGEGIYDADSLQLGYPFESSEIDQSIRGRLGSWNVSAYLGVSPRFDPSFVREGFAVPQDVDFPVFMDEGQMDFELDVALEEVLGARLNLMLPVSLVGRGGMGAAEFDNTYRFAPAVAFGASVVRPCIGLHHQFLVGGMFQSGPERFDDVAALRFGARLGIDSGEDLVISLLQSIVGDIGVSDGASYTASDLDAVLSLQADGFCWRFIGSYDGVMKDDQSAVQAEFRIERPVCLVEAGPGFSSLTVVPSAGLRYQSHSSAGDASYHFYGLEAQLGSDSSHFYCRWEFDDVNDASFFFGARISALPDMFGHD